MFDFVALGGSEGESMTLSWGGEEGCVGSFMDSVHVKMRGPGGKKKINTINNVEETGDSWVARFEFGDVVVGPAGEFVAD